jgi:hypothetical protein
LKEDYPADGPDIYYFLVDILDSAQDIKWLKEKNLTLDCVVHVSSTKEETKHTHMLYGQLSDLMQQNSQVLADTLFRELSENDDFAERVYSVVNLKKRYNEWLGKTLLVPLADVNVKPPSSYSFYSQSLDNMPSNALTTSFLSKSMVDQITCIHTMQTLL